MTASKKILMLLLLALFIPGTSQAAKNLTVKMATLAPDGSSWDKLLKEMASTWKTGTEGRVELKLYPGGVAGDDPDIVRKMRVGQLQGAALTVAGLVDLEPGFQVFGIPLFFDSPKEFLYVRGKLTDLLTQRLDEKGFKFLGWGHGGWVHIFLVKPVKTVEEIQAVKIFTWAGDDRMAQVWKGTGFTPVPLSATDILTGLQTGLIEAIPAPPYVALAMQWFRQTPYMLDVGLAPLIGGTVISKKTWEKISPEDQAILLESAADPDNRIFEDISRGDEEAVTEMQKRGLTVIDIDENSGPWAERARVFAEQMRKTIVAEDMYQIALKYRTEFRESSGAAP